MASTTGLRARVRTELVQEIKDEARRQVEQGGAASLSLRAVAREMGMVSSGIYRYFPSRDQLLTALIIDAYDAVGAEVEVADAACRRTDFTGRWRAACHAVRGWALEHPHEYALAYGSPVPGYSAPEDTIGPASRVTQVVAAVVRDAAVAGTLRSPFGSEQTPGPSKQTALETAVAAVVMPGVPVDAVVRSLTAWTQLFGFVSFEVFGRFVDVVADCDALFEQAVTDVGAFIGFTSPEPDPAGGGVQAATL